MGHVCLDLIKLGGGTPCSVIRSRQSSPIHIAWCLLNYLKDRENRPTVCMGHVCLDLIKLGGRRRRQRTKQSQVYITKPGVWSAVQPGAVANECAVS